MTLLKSKELVDHSFPNVEKRLMCLASLSGIFCNTSILVLLIFSFAFTRRCKDFKTKISDVFVGYNDDTCSAIILEVWEKHTASKPNKQKEVPFLHVMEFYHRFKECIESMYYSFVTIHCVHLFVMLVTSIDNCASYSFFLHCICLIIN